MSKSVKKWKRYRVEVGRSAERYQAKRRARWVKSNTQGEDRGRRRRQRKVCSTCLESMYVVPFHKYDRSTWITVVNKWHQCIVLKKRWKMRRSGCNTVPLRMLSVAGGKLVWKLVWQLCNTVVRRGAQYTYLYLYTPGRTAKILYTYFKPLHLRI